MAASKRISSANAATSSFHHHHHHHLRRFPWRVLLIVASVMVSLSWQVLRSMNLAIRESDDTLKYVDYPFPSNKTNKNNKPSTTSTTAATYHRFIKVDQPSNTSPNHLRQVSVSKPPHDQLYHNATTTHTSLTADVDNNDKQTSLVVHDTGLPAVLHFPSHLDGRMELQMELEGLNGSQGLQWIHDVRASMLYPNVSWIGSPRPNRPCNDVWIRQAVEFYEQLQQQLQQGKPRRRRQRRSTQQNQTQRVKRTAAIVKPDWTIHLSDWFDSPYQLLRCVRLEAIIGVDKFRYWKRSVVVGRYWNNVTQSIVLGTLVTSIGGMPVHYLSYPVRTDLAQSIQQHVEQLHGGDGGSNGTMNNASAITHYLVTKERPGDVAHYWPAVGGKVDRGSKFGSNSELRTKTSETLLRMMLPPYNLTKVFCGEQGSVGNKGRKTVSEKYVESMLYYKIIVVAQRDNWEGHWRMLEAMISGAMVIHDRMLAVPIGLKENVSIVLYDNMDDLIKKVMYYLTHDKERLEIARRGRQVAMCNHRSWHRLEEIVLGRPVTPCYE